MADQCTDCVIEPITNIQFPRLLTSDGIDLVCLGCGVRKKFLINVYAVGTYVDKSVIKSLPIYNDSKLDHEVIQNVLCNPILLPRIIRIVTNWNIPTYLVTKGITDAIRPRLTNKISNEDMIELENKLHSLMNSNDYGEALNVGVEFLLFVKGDTMYYSRSSNKSSFENIHEEKKIQHKEFCFALCDVYYGNDVVSTDHKYNIIEGFVQLVVDKK